MKRTSKIFLIVAAIIVAAGFVICIVGVGVSAAAGDQLFAKSTDEGKGYTYSFGDQGIDKIKLDVTDADINITGGSDEAYIEIINFNENLYTFQSNKALISFKESPDVSSVLRFWESGFTFKGMRYLLHPAATDGGKIINIYLTDSESVKNFEIIAKNCDLSVANLGSMSDYNITLDTGSVKLDAVNTGSTVSVLSESADGVVASFKDCTAKKIAFKATKATVSGENITLTGAAFDITTGSLSLGFTPALTPFTVDVSTKAKLTVNGESLIDKFSYPPKTAADTTADTGKAQSETTADTENPAVISATGRDLAVTLDFPVPEDTLAKTDTQK